MCLRVCLARIILIMDDTSSYPIVRLEPVQIPGRTEIARELVLKYTVKVGRAVANRVKPSHTNAIFDSKVLSRTHAEIWADKGKVYIQDTKSSNGTYLDDRRLSPSTRSSEPEELKTGMILKLGVDVTENHQASHKCVTLRVTVVYPEKDNNDALDALTAETWIPVPALIAQGEAAINNEITVLREAHTEQQAKLVQLSKALNEVTLNEKTRTQQLQSLALVLDRLESSADETISDFLQEDKLLSRIDAMESQLKYYMTRYPHQDDEMQALRQAALEASNARYEHEMHMKSVFKRGEEEKAFLFQRLQQQKADRANTFKTIEVQLIGKQKEIDDMVTERTELLDKFQELQATTVAMTDKAKGLQMKLDAANLHIEGNSVISPDLGIADESLNTGDTNVTEMIPSDTIYMAQVKELQEQLQEQLASATKKANEAPSTWGVDKLKDMITKLKAQNIGLEEDITNLNHQVELEREAVKLAEANAASKTLMSKEIEILQSKLQVKDTELSDVRKKLSKALATSTIEADSIRQEVESKLAEAAAKLGSANSTIDKLTVNLADKSKAVSISEKSRKELDEKLANLQKKLDTSNKAKAHAQNESKTAREEAKRAKKAKTELSQKYEAEIQEHKNATKSLESLRRDKDSMVKKADKRAEVALKEAATLKQNLSAAESRVKQVNELLEVNSTKENVTSASMGMQRLVFFVCGSAVAAAAAHFVGTSSSNN